MMKFKYALLFAFVLAACGLSHASTSFPWGANCQGGCGQNPNGVIYINLNNLADPNNPTCVLYDSNLGDPVIPCGTQLSDYNPLTFPSTVDPSVFKWTVHTSVPTTLCMIYGRLLNASDTFACDQTGGSYNVGTVHTVLTPNIMPATRGGNGSGSATFYIWANTAGTAGNPGTIYDSTGASWPGPNCYQRSYVCYMQPQNPNPGPSVPLQFNGLMLNTNASEITQGYPSWLSTNIVWTNANAINTSQLPTCGAGQLNMVAHLYPSAGSYSAPNSLTWVQCDGAGHWNSMGSSLPQLVATDINICVGGTGNACTGGTKYQCPGSVNGGHDPITRKPKDFCVNGPTSAQVSATFFYTGNHPNNSSTDYRQISYSSGLGAYYADMNALEQPQSITPNSVVEVYPCDSTCSGGASISGAATLNVTLTLYTDGSLATVAPGTTPIFMSVPINISSAGSVAVHVPASFSTQTKLPAYYANNAIGLTNLCSNAGYTNSMDYWNLTIHTWMWYPPGASDFAEAQTWNYDNSRVFSNFRDIALQALDGSQWSQSWGPGQLYGSTMLNVALKPGSDPNGNVWVAYVANCQTFSGTCGATSGTTEPNWASAPNQGAQLTDGSNGLKWINVGTPAYWNRCMENAGAPYRNMIAMMNGGVSEWALFTGGMDKIRQRTNDAIKQNGTTITGRNSTSEKLLSGNFSSFQPYSTSVSRSTAYALDAAMTYWRTVCSQGNCSQFTGNNQMLRNVYYDMVGIFNYWSAIRNTKRPSVNYAQGWSPIITFYTGLGMEALIEMYNTAKELDPGNGLGFQDPRVFYEIKKMADWYWTYQWDQVWKGGNGVHSYSFGYNPNDVATALATQPFVGTNFNGMMGPAYAFLYAYCGGDATCHAPDGTTYDAIYDLVSVHQYDGNADCFWTCRLINLPYSGGLGTPKEAGQTNKWDGGNGPKWRNGKMNWYETDLSPTQNPCWDTGTVPCASGTLHPFADTEQPYMFHDVAPGGNASQDDPGCESHFADGKACSPIKNITSTSATVVVNNFEQLSLAKINYGTTTSCNTGSVSTQDSGFPQILNRNIPYYLNQWSLTGLSPNTTYYIQFCFTDMAGNVSCNNCGSTPGGWPGGGINFKTAQQVIPVITTVNLPSGQNGVLYNCGSCLTGAGGTGTYTWSISVGSLPAGLSLDPTTCTNSTVACKIVGTPTGGSSTFTVAMHDSNNQQAQPKQLSITIQSLIIDTLSLPSGTQNQPYVCGTCLTAHGGTTPYTWTCFVACTIPPGMTLTTVSNVGTLSGTPTSSGTFGGAFCVTDSSLPTNQNACKPFLFTIAPSGNPLTITSTSPLPTGTEGAPYTSFTFSGTGGTGSGYQWTKIGGTLPTGLTLSLAGVLSGTPAVGSQGDYSPVIQLKDSGNNTTSKTFALHINAATLVICSPAVLPTGTLNHLYTYTLCAQGGAQPYVWSIIGGTLPNGIQLSTGGVLSGTPTSSGTFFFTLEVTDNNGVQATQQFQLQIVGPNPPTAMSGSISLTGSGKIR